jgi:ABC-type Fe3+-hydroxamate transport system substrate-binding protein
VQQIPVIGGTKDVSVRDVIALAPDIVLANQEENSKSDVLALRAAGLNVRLTFPKTVEDGFQDFEALAACLGLDRPAIARPAPCPMSTRKCFVPIWRLPWMTINGQTYIGDVLRWLGLVNVFEHLPSEDAQGKDSRYARLTMDQMLQAQPDVVLLGDDPYPFGSEHVHYFRSLDIPAARTGAIFRVSGRDLCWPGAWAEHGLLRLRKVMSVRDEP